ncbi:MAG: hypothetical protein ACREKH_16290, partial [Candidatus Rokuibacteriota bacterium]
MEQFLLLALFLLVAFASTLARWLKARMKSPPPPATEPRDDVIVRPPARPFGQSARLVDTPTVARARPAPRPPVETRRPR